MDTVDIASVDFEKLGGLVPAVVQDENTMRVLMVGFMNKDALLKTLQEKKVTFFSRTKNRLWTKGESSGNFLHLVSIKLDCDKDTFLLKVRPVGVVCHTGSATCFGEETNEVNIHFLQTLENIVEERANQSPEESYTARLLQKGVHKVSQKVGEEAVEVVIDAMRGDKDRFKEECADLLYHLTVLLKSQNVRYDEVMQVLQERHQSSAQ